MKYTLAAVQAHRIGLLYLLGLYDPQPFAIGQVNQTASIIRDNTRNAGERLDRLQIGWVSHVQNRHRTRGRIRRTACCFSAARAHRQRVPNKLEVSRLRSASSGKSFELARGRWCRNVKNANAS